MSNDKGSKYGQDINVSYPGNAHVQVYNENEKKEANLPQPAENSNRSIVTRGKPVMVIHAR